MHLFQVFPSDISQAQCQWIIRRCAHISQGARVRCDHDHRHLQRQQRGVQVWDTKLCARWGHESKSLYIYIPIYVYTYIYMAGNYKWSRNCMFISYYIISFLTFSHSLSFCLPSNTWRKWSWIIASSHLKSHYCSCGTVDNKDGFP